LAPLCFRSDSSNSVCCYTLLFIIIAQSSVIVNNALLLSLYCSGVLTNACLNEVKTHYWYWKCAHSIIDTTRLILFREVLQGEEGRKDKSLWVGLRWLDNLEKRFRYEFQTFKIREGRIVASNLLFL